MTATTLGQPNENRFSLGGICPHCNRASAFLMVTGAHIEQITNLNRTIASHHMWAVLQCQACKKYIVGAAMKDAPHESNCKYLEHCPLGKPSDDVSTEIPKDIADDFKEALRCRWVNAYNATVEMCRRAVQASCLQLKAPTDKTLVKQIDWLAEQGTITKPLKEMAHRVRLGGNLGAHPPDDPEDEDVIIISPEYADAVIEFTRDYFQHVYVMPERLKKFTFSRKPPGPST
jgi:Domain of unknown function (DUF4145)